VFSQVICVCIAGILALRFLFSILWCSHTGYHSQEELAKFGYRSERNVEKRKDTAIFSWPAGICCLNKVISEKKFLRNWWFWCILFTKFLCVGCTQFFLSPLFLNSDYFKNAIWGFKHVTFLTDQIKCQFTFIQILLTLVICLSQAIQL
jgi:hypothetical protein